TGLRDPASVSLLYRLIRPYFASIIAIISRVMKSMGSSQMGSSQMLQQAIDDLAQWRAVRAA
ncbi:hypothetical protein, partial [Escherichia coli]|uniref:hypothetical protein n=1 Tax=Escherichia coli TaxID=562 RepID=UPI003AF388E1